MIWSLDERRKALENQFFHDQDERLLEHIRADRDLEEKREELSRACGIRDEKVLTALLSLGIDAHTLVALALVPLVAVAWADGEVAEAEREALLEAADDCGIEKGEPTHALLDHWLRERPFRGLFEAWLSYVRRLAEPLDEEQCDALRADFAGRARLVAEASGGLLGLTNRISRSEEVVLRQIESAFEPGEG